MSDRPLALVVNGRAVELGGVPDDERLLDTLRYRLGLIGTKEGCRSGGCGACTVLVDGESVLSCLALAREAADADILTVEGLADDPQGRRVQAAFEAESATQCGYCTPGFVVELTGLLKARPRASARELLEGVQGHLCRCTGYASIRRAVARTRTGGRR